MSQMKNSDYVHGTSARKIQHNQYGQHDQYDVYEKNRVLKEKRKYRSNRFVKIKVVLSVLLVSVIGFTAIYRYALITDLNYKINKLKVEHKELVNDNLRLRIAIEKNTDLAEIKSVAENRLSMQKPDKYQIIYIRIPKDNFTVASDTYKNKEENRQFLTSILNKVDIFKRLLE